jgi:hypothetical protein
MNISLSESSEADERRGAIRRMMILAGIVFLLLFAAAYLWYIPG